MIQIGVAGKFYTIPKRSIQVSAAESAAVGLEALHKLNGISLKIFNHKEYQQFRLHACASASGKTTTTKTTIPVVIKHFLTLSLPARRCRDGCRVKQQ